MNSKKFILIVAGEPNSIFSEIYFKALKKMRTKHNIVLIASLNLIKLQMKKLRFKIKINILNEKKISFKKINKNAINLINVDYKVIKAFEMISPKSKNYINKCFKIAFNILKKNNVKGFINGPINKKTFLSNKFPGVTEYISKNFNVKKNAMLIFNKKLSVCPVTTHLPIRSISKQISKKKIIEKVELINEFYKIKQNKKPKIAITGLNPHCETTKKINEDEKIIKPAIKILKNKKYNVYGPFSADTIFLKNNRRNYDVVLGMYHDQVLAPMKTLFEYDAINITLGLPFIRISPDHGPNEKMLGKNLSNPLSLIQAINFLDKN